jgi:hypothetical protein
MKRREFIAWLSGGAAAFPLLWPVASRGQNPVAANQSASAADDNLIGQVASMTGNATVTRSHAGRAPLKVADAIYAKDILQTDVNSSLGVTFDDETTFNLSANTRITIDSFVYQQGGHSNLASFNVATGTASFIASLVAKTGDMKVSTPEATLGIRGTTGIIEVPAAGGVAAPSVKLYPDADGHVGRIEVFNRQGASLGTLTQGASAFGPASWSRRPARCGAVSNSRPGSGTRSRRLATAQSHPHHRPPDADPAAKIAWTRPARSEQSAPARPADPAAAA